MKQPKIILSNKLNVQGIKPDTITKIKEALTIDNPEYENALKYGKGRPTRIKKQLMFFFEDLERGLLCPRSFWHECSCIIAEQEGRLPNIIDLRNKQKNINVRFVGRLKNFQNKAVAIVLKNDFGVLRAPTGSGKTVMALKIIAERKQPTLILVHTKELLDQWIERINKFLQMPMVGVLGGGKKEIYNVTVATVQTAKNMKEELSERFSQVIVDECHRAPAFQYMSVIDQINARYMLGLSATPYRRDKLTQIMHWYIGPEVAKVETKELKERGIICEAIVNWVKTDFTTVQNGFCESSTNYSKAISKLTKDKKRNELIIDAISHCKKEGVLLVLTDRKGHGQELQQMLIKENIQASLLTGSTPANERENIVEELNKGKIQTVIATSQLIGEGFDLPSMQKIFLTTPIKHHGRLIQYIGRVLRHDIGKRRAVIYDFYDAYDPVLRASAENRSKTYKAEFVKEINKPEPPQLKCKKCSKKFRSWANAVLCPSCQNKLFNHKR